MQGRHWGTLPSHAEQKPRSACGVGALLLCSDVAILKYCTRALTLSLRLGTHKMPKRGTGAGAGADPRDLLKKRDFERSPSLSINSQRRLRAQQKVWQESCAAPHVHLREVDGPVVVGVGSGQHLLHLLVTAQTYRRADKRAGGHAHARTRTAGRQVGRGARTHLRTPYMPSDRDNTPPPLRSQHTCAHPSTHPNARNRTLGTPGRRGARPAVARRNPAGRDVRAETSSGRRGATPKGKNMKNVERGGGHVAGDRPTGTAARRGGG